MKIILLVLVTVPCWAAAFTSKAAGNWSSSGQTTWNEVGVPGNGDTVSITHAITVDSNVTVGTSPSDSSTIVVTTTANLTIAAGVTFTVRGGMKWAASVILSAGSNWVADPTQATDRTLAAYTFGPTASSIDNKVVGTACTQSQPCSIYTLRTYGNEARASFQLFGLYYELNGFDVRWTNFTDLGSSTTPAIAFHQRPTAGYGVNTFDIRNSTFTRCGAIRATYAGGDDIINLQDNIFVDGLATENMGGSTWTTVSTGSVSYSGNYFDRQLGGADPNGAIGPAETTANYNVVVGKWRVLQVLASFDHNVIFDTQDVRVDNGSTNNVFVNSVADNPHFLGGGATTIDGSTVSGNVFEYAGAGGGGDVLSISSAAGSAKTITLSSSIYLKSSAGHGAGTIASWGTVTDAVKVITQRNTFWVNNNYSHGLFFNECTTCTPAGTITNYKSNLGWSTSQITGSNPPAAAGGNHFAYQGTPNDNVLLDAGADYNTCYNCMAATVSGPANGTMYNVPLAVGQTVPGQHDLNINPGFADPSRTVELWAVTKGQANSLAGAQAALKVAPLTRIPDLLNWLRQGFAPCEIRLATAGHDGSYVGAVKPVGLFGAF